jgi:hypothetical protein
MKQREFGKNFDHFFFRNKVVRLRHAVYVLA